MMESNELARLFCEAAKCCEVTSPKEKRVCPDQYVGLVSCFVDGDSDFPVRFSVDKRPEDLPCLIMVLESPHTAEYNDDLGSPAPAKGGTGENIRTHLRTVAGMEAYAAGYGLILINAIQYQCSLGVSTKEFRNKVFRKMWPCPKVSASFVERLNKIYRPQDVIVNSCTKGDVQEGQSLRTLVQHELEGLRSSTLTCATFLWRTHPSSWHRLANRTFIVTK